MKKADKSWVLLRIRCSLIQSKAMGWDMSTVFVTGGSGFVGRNLIRELIRRGVAVKALARSESSVEAVRSLGAAPVPGDLDGIAVMHAAMRGCDAVFHSAAKVEEWGDPASYVHINVLGTQNVLQAAREAAVAKFIHVSTEAVLADGNPLVQVNESWPYPENPIARYPVTKAKAEKLVIAANCDAMQTVSIRPRFIWGGDDTSLLPQLISAVQTGRFMWIDGGRYLSSTTHIDNVVEGLLCGWEQGEGGQCYFVSDGEPVEFREFITALLASQGVEIPDKSVPLWVIRGVAAVTEKFWGLANIQSPPPATKVLVGLVGQEVTIDDSRARNKIGYQGLQTRKAGLQAMRESIKN